MTHLESQILFKMLRVKPQPGRNQLSESHSSFVYYGLLSLFGPNSANSSEMVFWKLELNKVSRANSQVTAWVVSYSCTGQVKRRGEKDEGITVSAVALVMHVNESWAWRF